MLSWIGEKRGGSRLKYCFNYLQKKKTTPKTYGSRFFLIRLQIGQSCQIWYRLCMENLILCNRMRSTEIEDEI